MTGIAKLFSVTLKLMKKKKGVAVIIVEVGRRGEGKKGEWGAEERVGEEEEIKK